MQDAPTTNDHDCRDAKPTKRSYSTAPSLAGKDRANPGSLILSGALMLEHIGWKEAATRIYKAVNTAIARRAVTEDLAAQMTDARTVGCTEFGEIITKLL